MHFSIQKGLDLPLSGEPIQTIEAARHVTSVAILGNEYNGMKPTMLVEEGQSIKLGQALFTDKKNPRVTYTSPGAGTIKAIKRGSKRILQAVIIELQGDEEVTFDRYDPTELNQLEPEKIKQNLLDSGLWTAIRTRPYSKSPDPDSSPSSIFVTAIDTKPLAANPILIIDEHNADYAHGLTILSQLTKGKVFVCQSTDTVVQDSTGINVETHTFSGPDPAGLASTEDIIKDELEPVQSRVISGSVLSGHTANNWAAYLGRFHNQISVIAEGNQREFFGWIMPGTQKFSALNVFISKLMGKKSFNLTTSQNGSPRAMVPVGAFEMMMPLDILPTQLLRALLVKDTDMAQALGCLELDEEDLALCSFVCSGKFDYGYL
jgi:Na+-transporting NADH:ubiquinone oxidoreductase subunit A